MDIVLLLALAFGLFFFFFYAAQAAFKADSRARENINKRFEAIVKAFRGESDDAGDS